MPGSGGRIGAAPGDRTSLSYFSVVTSPVTWFLRSTVFCSGEMPTTSQRVRTSMANCSRNVCSVATRRLDSCAITPPTWYGSPQFAYDTYGPRSTIRISAVSSNRRSRAAQDAPPATPPTMMTFMLSHALSLSHSFLRLRVLAAAQTALNWMIVLTSSGLSLERLLGNPPAARSA